MTGRSFDDGMAQVTAAVHHACGEAAFDWAEHVLGEAVRIVPIDTAALQNSGTTAVDWDEATGYVGFGTGPAAGYAVRQHEVRMNHAPGRTDHYLSIPVHRSEAAAEEILARRLRIEFQ